MATLPIMPLNIIHKFAEKNRVPSCRRECRKTHRCTECYDNSMTDMLS